MPEELKKAGQSIAPQHSKPPQQSVEVQSEEPEVSEEEIAELIDDGFIPKDNVDRSSYVLPRRGEKDRAKDIVDEIFQLNDNKEDIQQSIATPEQIEELRLSNIERATELSDVAVEDGVDNLKRNLGGNISEGKIKSLVKKYISGSAKAAAVLGSVDPTDKAAVKKKSLYIRKMVGDFTNSIANVPIDIQNAVVGLIPQFQDSKQWDSIDLKDLFYSEEEEKSLTGIEKFGIDMTAYLVAFSGIAKSTGLLKSVSGNAGLAKKSKAILSNVILNGVVDGLIIDTDDDNLVDFLTKYPALQNEITAWLSNGGEESNLKKRVNNAIIGMGFSAGIDSAIAIAQGVKAVFRISKAQTQMQTKVAKDVAQTKGLSAEELTSKPVESPKAKVAEEGGEQAGKKADDVIDDEEAKLAEVFEKNKRDGEFKTEEINDFESSRVPDDEPKISDMEKKADENIKALAEGGVTDQINLKQIVDEKPSKKTRALGPKQEQINPITGKADEGAPMVKEYGKDPVTDKFDPQIYETNLESAVDSFELGLKSYGINFQRKEIRLGIEAMIVKEGVDPKKVPINLMYHYFKKVANLNKITPNQIKRSFQDIARSSRIYKGLGKEQLQKSEAKIAKYYKAKNVKELNKISNKGLEDATIGMKTATDVAAHRAHIYAEMGAISEAFAILRAKAGKVNKKAEIQLIRNVQMRLVLINQLNQVSSMQGQALKAFDAKIKIETTSGVHQAIDTPLWKKLTEGVDGNSDLDTMEYMAVIAEGMRKGTLLKQIDNAKIDLKPEDWFGKKRPIKEAMKFMTKSINTYAVLSALSSPSSKFLAFADGVLETGLGFVDQFSKIPARFIVGSIPALRRRAMPDAGKSFLKYIRAERLNKPLLYLTGIARGLKTLSNPLKFVVGLKKEADLIGGSKEFWDSTGTLLSKVDKEKTIEDQNVGALVTGFKALGKMGAALVGDLTTFRGFKAIDYILGYINRPAQVILDISNKVEKNWATLKTLPQNEGKSMKDVIEATYQQSMKNAENGVPDKYLDAAQQHMDNYISKKDPTEPFIGFTDDISVGGVTQALKEFTKDSYIPLLAPIASFLGVANSVAGTIIKRAGPLALLNPRVRAGIASSGGEKEFAEMMTGIVVAVGFSTLFLRDGSRVVLGALTPKKRSENFNTYGVPFYEASIVSKDGKVMPLNSYGSIGGVVTLLAIYHKYREEIEDHGQFASALAEGMIEGFMSSTAVGYMMGFKQVFDFVDGIVGGDEMRTTGVAKMMQPNIIKKIVDLKKGSKQLHNEPSQRQFVKDERLNIKQKSVDKFVSFFTSFGSEMLGLVKGDYENGTAPRTNWDGTQTELRDLSPRVGLSPSDFWEYTTGLFGKGVRIGVLRDEDNKKIGNNLPVYEELAELDDYGRGALPSANRVEMNLYPDYNYTISSLVNTMEIDNLFYTYFKDFDREQNPEIHAYINKSFKLNDIHATYLTKYASGDATYVPIGYKKSVRLHFKSDWKEFTQMIIESGNINAPSVGEMSNHFDKYGYSKTDAVRNLVTNKKFLRHEKSIHEMVKKTLKTKGYLNPEDLDTIIKGELMKTARIEGTLIQGSLNKAFQDPQAKPTLEGLDERFKEEKGSVETSTLSLLSGAAFKDVMQERTYNEIEYTYFHNKMFAEFAPMLKGMTGTNPEDLKENNKLLAERAANRAKTAINELVSPYNQAAKMMFLEYYLSKNVKFKTIILDGVKELQRQKSQDTPTEEFPSNKVDAGLSRQGQQ